MAVLSISTLLRLYSFHKYHHLPDGLARNKPEITLIPPRPAPTNSPFNSLQGSHLQIRSDCITTITPTSPVKLSLLRQGNGPQGVLSRLNYQLSPLLSTLHSLHHLWHKPWSVGQDPVGEDLALTASSITWLFSTLNSSNRASPLITRTPSSPSLDSTHAVPSAGNSCSRFHCHLNGRCLFFFFSHPCLFLSRGFS